MKLVVAEGKLLEEIIEATFPLWNEGLTRSAYGQWNAAQMRTEWGAENLHRFAIMRGEQRSEEPCYRVLTEIARDVAHFQPASC